MTEPAVGRPPVPSSAAGAEIPPLPPGFRRKMLVVTTLFVSLMASIDLTIVSVALPYMAGSLSATPVEITWVLTMFTIGQAIVIGITGHLSRLLGRKRLAIIVVAGFVATSALCGMAQSLDQIVVFRFLQGCFSGPLIPLSQSMLADAFPPEERTGALAIWAMGVMGGPAAGPALGGYLTQQLDWRWNFWVNFPVGVIALLLILAFVRPVTPQRVRTDWFGLLLLGLFIVSLQIALDQGNTLDWFGSQAIVALAVVSTTAGLAFIARGIVVGSDNIINLRLFADRNLAACSLLIAIIGSIYLALLVITPELFIDYFGWQVDTAGLVIGSFGIAGLTGSYLSGRLAPILGVRVLVVTAGLIMAAGWYLLSRVNLDTGPSQVVVPGMLVEFGLMLIFAPLAAQVFTNLRPEQRDEGAGVFNFVKTLGFSFGVTLVDTLLYRGNQANWNRYVGDIGLANPGLAGFAQRLGVDPASPAAGAVLGQVLEQQTGMLTMVQAAEVMAVLSICSVPLALLMKSGRKVKTSAAEPA